MTRSNVNVKKTKDFSRSDFMRPRAAGEHEIFTVELLEAFFNINLPPENKPLKYDGRYESNLAELLEELLHFGIETRKIFMTHSASL